MQRSPYQDGVTYVDGQIQERGMQLEFLIVAENKNHMAQLRRKISSIFNPKLVWVNWSAMYLMVSNEK
ncbi:phage tail family protein [Paenibacillus larvae]|nr:phage tail domain-containing protein [Paenibacillus larvae]MDT2255700.1 phage tail family protein [Paenibacillus larvae]